MSMGIVEKLEVGIQIISAIIGAFVFSLGVGSLAVAGLRLAGFGWNAIWAYPITLVASLLACVFTRLFFMRFAIPIFALFSDELGSDNSPYSFTLLQVFMSFALTVSLFALFVFAYMPNLKLVGVLGTIGFVTYLVWSKSLTACYNQPSPSRDISSAKGTERDITGR